VVRSELPACVCFLCFFVCFVCFVWFVCFVCFVCFVWFVSLCVFGSGLSGSECGAYLCVLLCVFAVFGVSQQFLRVLCGFRTLCASEWFKWFVCGCVCFGVFLCVLCVLCV